jgi:hypothetical protein
MTRSRNIALAAIAALGVGLAASPVASAEDNKEPFPGVKCTEFGGGKPGDKKTLTETTVVNGKKVTKTYTVICGSDGKWHEVAKFGVVTTSTRPTTVTLTYNQAY